jgi:hypothetical protein
MTSTKVGGCCSLKTLARYTRCTGTSMSSRSRSGQIGARQATTITVE